MFNLVRIASLGDMGEHKVNSARQLELVVDSCLDNDQQAASLTDGLKLDYTV